MSTLMVNTAAIEKKYCPITPDLKNYNEKTVREASVSRYHEGSTETLPEILRTITTLSY